MTYAFIISVSLLVLVGITLLLSNPRNIALRWFSAAIFCTIFGAFHSIIAEIITPIYSFKIRESIMFLTNLSGFFNTIPYYFIPYCFLLFSIYCTGDFLKKRPNLKNNLKFLLLIPIVIMYLFFPVSDFTSFNNYHISYLFFAVWSSPYNIFGIILLFYSYFNAKNVKYKKELFRINLMIIPTMIADLIVCHILLGIGILSFIKYLAFIEIFPFIIFLFFLLKDGIFGVRLRFDKYRLDSVMQILPSGSAVLNHALKNEITNISLSAYIANENPTIKNDPTLHQCLQTVLNSTQNVIGLVTRLNEQMKEIVLNESPNNLIV